MGINDTLKHEILNKLGPDGIRREYESWGVVFQASKPNSSGRLACLAFGRDEKNASAAVCVQSSNGSLGQYLDSGNGHKHTFFYFAVKVANRFQSYPAAIEHYARRTGVDYVPKRRGRKRKGQEIAAATLATSPATPPAVADTPLAVEMLIPRNRERLSRLWLARWLPTKPGITREAIEKTKWRLAEWDNRSSVIAFECFRPDNWDEPKGFKLFQVDGKVYGDVGRSCRNLNGSRDAALPIGSKSEWEAAHTILFCEGETDALTAAASPALPAGWFVIGLMNGAGSLTDTIAGFASGKRAVVCGDADKPGIDGAWVGVRNCLKVSSDVRFHPLPYEVAEKHGKDLRDLVNEGGFAAWLAEVEALPPVTEANLPATENDAKQQEEENEDGLVKQLSDEICKSNHFAQDPGGKLYRFSGGVYVIKGDEFIRRRVKATLLFWKQSEDWNTRLVEQVVEFIRVDAPTLWDRPPLDTINVLNGLLRISDRQLRPHSPEYLSTVQLPVDYDPAATCPETEKFVASVFPKDAIGLAWEVAGYLMVPATFVQKAVLLIGPGGNGKSRWLNQLVAFLGRGNVSGASLHKLEADKFAGKRLLGKLANICPDLPSEHLSGTSVFKAITGGDAIDGEYKFGEAFEFVPFARLVFSANHAPRSADSSPGFFRRWLVVPLEKTFEGTTEWLPPDALDAKLTTPAELSGLLNKALNGLGNVIKKQGFSDAESCKLAGTEFEQETSPFGVWMDRHVVFSANAHISKKVLRSEFNAHLEHLGRPSITEKMFGIEFGKKFPNVTTGQRTINGKVEWCYLGIGLAAAQRHSQHSQHSHLSYLPHDHKEDESRKHGESNRNGQVLIKEANAVNAVNDVNGRSHLPADQ